MSGRDVRTMLVLSGRGLNFAGMESQVVRPMMTTAFFWAVVTCLKNFISLASRQGRPPLSPMPNLGTVAARIRVVEGGMLRW